MKRISFILLLFNFLLLLSSNVYAFFSSSFPEKRCIADDAKISKRNKNHSAFRFANTIQDLSKSTLKPVPKELATFQQVQKYVDRFPFVAVIRDIFTLEDITSCIDVLYSEGYKLISIAVDTFDNGIERKDASSTMLDWDTFKRIQKHYENHDSLNIGISTCLNMEQARSAQKAGATFITTPHTDTAMIRTCINELNLFILPGGATPSDILNSYNCGVRHMKLFPSSIVSPEYVRSIKGIIPSDMKLILSGGIDSHNIAAYKEMGINGFIFGRSLVSIPYNEVALRGNASKISEMIKTFHHPSPDRSKDKAMENIH